jgi:hypothetical protein
MAEEKEKPEPPEEKESVDTQSQMSPPVPESKSAEASIKELKEAIRGSNEVLAQATTVLTLFPDVLTVDRAKLTITKRNFFRSAEVMSMRIEDILNVTTTVGPLFGNVKIASRVMNEDQDSTIGRFWRRDAERIKRITQGYVIALQREIDCSALGTRELAHMLERLGADEHPS